MLGVFAVHFNTLRRLFVLHRCIQQVRLQRLRRRFKKRERKFSVFATNVEAHAHVAVNQAFFQNNRGEMDISDEIDDLQTVIDRRKYSEMSVKRKDVAADIRKIKKAHKEYSAFAKDLVENLERAAQSNAQPQENEMIKWADESKRMIVEEHKIHADFHELACMRSLSVIREMIGLFCVCFLGQF